MVASQKKLRKTIDFASRAVPKANSNTLLLYGPSGAGKTRECEALIRYVWGKYGKKTRYVTCDGGSWQPISPLWEAGMVDVIDLTASETNIVPTVRGLAQGYWLEKNETGEMVWKKPEDQTTIKDVGCYIFESLSSYSTAIINYFINKKVNASEDLVGFTALDNEDEELDALIGKQTLAKLSRSHYGLLADELINTVYGFRTLATTLDLNIVVFTTHESSNERELAKVKTVSLGPGAEGQKFASQLPRMVGDMFYLYPINTPKGVEYRAAFTPQPDPQLANKPWPARIRGSAMVTEEILKVPDLKNGYLVLTNELDPVNRKGITRILMERDRIEAEQTKKIQELLSKRTN